MSSRCLEMTLSNSNNVVLDFLKKSSAACCTRSRVSVTMLLSSGISSPNRKRSMRPSIRCAPKTLNTSSCNDKKKREVPGSPCLPARPLNWLSIRRDSWRHVPSTYSPPAFSTASLSSAKASLYNTLSIPKASLHSFISFRLGSSNGAPPPICATSSSAAKKVCAFCPRSLLARAFMESVSFAFKSSGIAMGKNSAGIGGIRA
mmetsp:Transcript_69244/g.129272  ORF Transcript_69244/g.129272 Transcript_69244/m.129272 type:complete len:203 (+) Transcript_69244:692-1300(+)